MTQRLMTVAELGDTSPPNRSDPLYLTLDALVMAREAGLLPTTEIAIPVIRDAGAFGGAISAKRKAF